METEKLHIPSGLSLRAEIFQGFGRAEALQAGIASAILCTGCALAYLTHHSLPGLIVSGIVCVSASVGAVTRDRYNLSLADHIKHLYVYVRQQQQYPYVYHCPLDEVTYENKA